MRTLLRTRFASALLFSTLLLSAPNLPDPPDGFSWKRLEEVRATFLLPNGWHVNSEERGVTHAYFFTPEKLKKDVLFDTGLTINVVKDPTEKDAVAYAQAFVAKSAQLFETIKQWQLEVGSFHGFGILTRQVTGAKEPMHVIGYLAIGNARTNTFYLLVFESPWST
jgi:hypothetical protein